MHKQIGLLCLLFALLSCNSHSENLKIADVNNSWDKKTAHEFQYEIKNAQEPKNIIFVVRNNNSYPYSNLRLIINVADQNKKTILTDTINEIMAKPDGSWIGKGFGEVKEIQFPFRNQFQFPADGTYTIGIVQAMREDKLQGIEDIGVIVEPSKP